jgi:hypothetical protein
MRSKTTLQRSLTVVGQSCMSGSSLIGQVHSMLCWSELRPPRFRFRKSTQADFLIRRLKIFASLGTYAHRSRRPAGIKITQWVQPTDPDSGPLVLKLSHSRSSLLHLILEHFHLTTLYIHCTSLHHECIHQPHTTKQPTSPLSR